MAVASDGGGCIMASTTARDGKDSISSLEAMFVVMVGRVGIGEVVIVVVLNNGVEAGLCTSISSRGGAQEAGVAGDESGSWVKNSTGGMRLASPVARLAVTRNGGDGDLEAVPCAVLAISMDGLLPILMRDAREPFDWLVCVFHLESPRIELKSLPANCCRRVGREDDLDWKAPSWAKVGGGVDVGDGEWYSV